ncbi:hypothetical protein DL767_006025 [Monosporascus sp. MG133]|nr:hypothetical protein DL767_006025 [Monosporascus sp. MG133]
MRRGHFPLDGLAAWCLLNDVTFVDTKVQHIEGRGYGLVAERELRTEDDNKSLTILKVPRDLVLSSEGVEEYARENKEFRQLLDAAGRLSTRHDILLFLLMQLVLSSPDHTAYFEENDDDQVLLLLRDGSRISPGTEITINYGHKKSAAEMLFSYGFIDPHSAMKRISLPLELIDDDPLIKAKLHVFGATPTLEINEDDGVPRWSAPFVYLMCLNEEDGLEFRMLQETDGSRHLRMLWQERDVTDAPGTFKDLINGHDLQPIFELRAVTVIYEMVQQQIERLSVHGGDASVFESVRAETMQAANQLRNIETDLLKRVFLVLENERANLLADESVLAYLGYMQAGQSGDIAEDADFS